MDWQIGGLPVHVLIVHFVVIVVPVAALATILTAAWPTARRRLGIVTPIIALAALISVPIATQAGEWLQAQVGNSELVREHAELGDRMLPWAIAVFLVAVAQWIWFHSYAPGGVRNPDAHRSGRTLAITVALAAAVAVTAVGSVVTVYLIGESGSKSVWSGEAG